MYVTIYAPQVEPFFPLHFGVPFPYAESGCLSSFVQRRARYARRGAPAALPDGAVITNKILEAALRWLSENPRVPTDAQIEDMKIKLVPVHPHWSNIVAEWQRRMFIAPDPEVDRVDFYIKTPDGEYHPWKPTEAQDEMRKSFDTAFGRFEIDDRAPPGEIRLHNWNGPTMLKVDAPEPEVEVVVIETKLGNRFRCTVKDGMIQSEQYYGHDPDAPHCGELWPRRIVEPEVPEQIKDLLLVDIREGFFKPEVINERMAECYRRGQKEGAK
jgi:hypothetical protein